METHNRLQTLLDLICTVKTGGNKAKLARAIQKDASYVNRLFYPATKKGAKGVGQEIMDVCKEAFGLPRGFWDMEPSEAELALRESSGASVRIEGKKEKTGGIVIRQYATGGSMGDGLVLRDQPGVIQSWDVSEEWVAKNVPHYTAIENLTIVTGFGDSMTGMYNPGDPLLVDKGVNTCEFDGVYFFAVEGEGFIKRLQRIPGEGILVISENRKYRDWTIKPTMRFEVLAKVLRVWESKAC